MAHLPVENNEDPLRKMDKAMKSGNPKVTVLMPIYNGETYLKKAIDSILSQTFQEFEFLIINDGSADKSIEVIKSYSDPRIRLIENEINLGLIATLNKGIDLARGKYIARMDQDDISLPERFARQIAFMDAHPEVGVCGTWAKIIDDTGRIVSSRRTPKGKAAHRLCWRPTPFIHPSCMLRSALLKEYHYRSGFPHAEDYDLWLRLCQKTQFANIGEYLFLYRIHDTNTYKTRRMEQLASAFAAFTSFIVPTEIDYEGFLALIPVVARVNPLRRAFFWLQVSKKTGLRIDEFILDNLIYLKLWLTRYDEQQVG